MHKLKKFLIDNNPKSILDIGTGTGNYINLLSSLYDGYSNIIGIDKEERFIKIAKEKNENDRVTYVHMDGANMSYEDESFDLVIFSNSLHHVEDLKPLFKEMERVVKKDGHVLISEMINNDLTSMQLSHMKLHHFAAKIDRLNGDVHKETYSESEIDLILSDFDNLILKDTWKMEVPLKESNTDEEITYILNMVDHLLKRAPEEHQESLQEEAESIKQYIKETGYDGCTTVIKILQNA